MTHQGFIGSLSTSVLLVSFAVAILLIVGAIVTFQGFPGPSVDDSTQPFAVGGLGTDARPEPELVVRARGAPDPGDEAAPVDAAATVEVAQTPAPPPAEPAVPTTTEAPPTVNVPAGDSGSGGSGSSGSSSDGGLTTTLRETVRDTSRTLESSVEKLLPRTAPVFDFLRRRAR